MEQENSKSIYFLRVAIMVSFVGFMIYGIVYALISPTILLPAIITIVNFLVMCGVIYIEYKRKLYNLAKYSILALLTSTIAVLVFGILGPEPGIQYFFLAFAVLPLILTSVRKVFFWVMSILINVSLFIWAEIYLENSLLGAEISEVIMEPFKVTTIIITISVICFSVWVLIITNMRSEKDLALGARVLKDNIKEMEEQQQLLKTAIATKDKFSSIIAHDLKNPVSTIQGFSQLLNEKFEALPPQKVRTFVEAIHQSSSSLDVLIKSLVQWSRSQDGRIELNKESFQLQRLFEQNVKLQKLSIEQKGLKLTSSCPPGQSIFADYNMIDTVVRNLLSNSIKFTPRGGKIELLARQNGEAIIIQVADTGLGMNEEAQEKLFRIDQTLSTEGTDGEKGSGLGLVIAQDFIKRNGGTISVESQMGKGTTFTIALPLVSTQD